MKKATKYIQVVTTISSREAAGELAAKLLDRRLAACVQIAGPVHSHYWWQGKQEEAQEWQCLIKTRRDLYPAVERGIAEFHPYETPEIIVFAIESGSPGYLSWLETELAKEK